MKHKGKKNSGLVVPNSPANQTLIKSMSFLKDLQRTHKERGQPRSRQRYGLLEKKKDYKLRSADYKKKQHVLQKLREKAANKNPDEFYFKMIRARTQVRCRQSV